MTVKGTPIMARGNAATSYAILAELAGVEDPHDLFPVSQTSSSVGQHTYMGPGSVDDFVDHEPAYEPRHDTLGFERSVWFSQWMRRRFL